MDRNIFYNYNFGSDMLLKGVEWLSFSFPDNWFGWRIKDLTLIVASSWAILIYLTLESNLSLFFVFLKPKVWANMSTNYHEMSIMPFYSNISNF